MLREEVISTCEVCGCKSNQWKIGGYPSKGRRLVCPGFVKYPELHNELAEKVWNSEETEHPPIYIKALNKEIERIRSKYFKSILPNI